MPVRLMSCSLIARQFQANRGYGLGKSWRAPYRVGWNQISLPVDPFKLFIGKHCALQNHTRTGFATLPAATPICRRTGHYSCFRHLLFRWTLRALNWLINSKYTEK